MEDRKLLGLFTANVLLSGVNSVASWLLPALQILLLLAQIFVAVATGIWMVKRLKRSEHK